MNHQEKNNPRQLVCVVDDGTKEIPIVNRFGKEICKIYFRPADLSIFDRYNTLTRDFENIVAPLMDIGITNTGEAEFESDWPKLKAVEQNLKDRINAMFDMEQADDIFAKRNPFSSVGGEFFCTKVLTAIGGIIHQTMDEEARLSKERVSKYLDDLEDTNNAGETTDKPFG